MLVLLMTYDTEISHDGRVIEKDNDKYLVKIISRSACAGCHTRGHCPASDQAEKLIEVVSPKDLAVGDDVWVIMAERQGRVAVFYAFVLPFLVMTIILILVYVLAGDERLAGLLALAGLGLYYLGLYFSRRHIGKDFVFTLEKINNEKR